LNYRSIDDLNRIIVENIYRIPKDVDLIVGIPRSGMLVGTILALHSNKQLTDVDGYIAGNLMSSGLSRKDIGTKVDSFDKVRKALVIDDSLLTGTEMSRVKKLIDNAGLLHKTIFATAICHPARVNEIDIAFDLCPPPRVFEWNLMHGHILNKCCVDIDGVLCLDPANHQNDDGPNYSDFLDNARPLWKPTAKIGTLVTSRLEKYRSQTESWLQKEGIKYDKLEMMQYSTMQERQAAKAYGKFKASIYSKSDKILFIESSEVTTEEIARLSGKPALCIESHNLYDPSGISHIKQKLKLIPKDGKSFLFRILRKIKNIIRG